MNRWFRWYRGTSENPKFRLAARNGGVTLITVMAVWQVILEDAAHEDHRGICEKQEDFIAAALDIADDGQVEAALKGLQYVDLISVGPGAITINRWKEWQYDHDVRDPTNADRQRRFRERKRAGNETVTERNGDVTDRNYPESDTETDTETEKKEKKGVDARASADAPPKAIDRNQKPQRLDPDWQPSAPAIDAAKAAGLSPDQIDRAVSRFRAHHLGTGTKAARWDLLFATWCDDDAAKASARKPQPATQTPADAVWIVEGSEAWATVTRARGRPPVKTYRAGDAGAWLRPDEIPKQAGAA